ncbi:MAG: Ig-like domain-containing protein [Nibricoccus sp.]
MNASRVSSLLRLMVSAVCASVLSAGSLLAIPAFPGAEGFGASATGGRGGTVYHVTNLNDSGAGSFREAVSVAGRTVVFDVGGIIRITSPIVVKANITIAGQTAPGDGIAVYGNRLSFSDANNTICRYIRFREGINGDSGTDTVGIASGHDMIFDHVSASWGRDETFSVSGSGINNITIQDCIIGQGLLVHSAGGLIQTSGGVSIFRTLYADNWMRNPKVKGVNDYINNVVYNWGSGGGYIPAGDSAGDTFANMIGCYFIGGPNSGVGTSPFKTGNLNYRLFHAGNFQDTNLDGVLDAMPVTDADFPTLQIVTTRFDYPAPATTLTAQQALQQVLTYSGASRRRDSVDTYMINEVLSYGTNGTQIYNESEVGGIGTLNGGLAPTDTDGDGMPDWWEQAAGTDPLVADNNVVQADGYTNLEHYINALAVTGVPGVAITGIVSDTGASTADGVTSDQTILIKGTAAAGKTVSLCRVDTGLVGTAVADASGQWTYDYTGTVLADRYYAFYAVVDLGGGKFSPATPAFVVKIDTVPAAAPAITSIVTNPAVVFSGTSEANAVVTVWLNGTAVGTATADDVGAWSATYTGPGLAPGAYSFTATAADLAGNVGSSSAAYLIDTTVAPPVFTGVVDDTGSATTDYITKDTTLFLNGTAPAGSTVTITRIGTGVIGTTVATGTGTFSYNYTGTTLASGVYKFSATATLGGSTSPASGTLTVTVDTVAPAISTINRSNPATASTVASTLVYRVTFAEPVTGVDTGDFTLTTSGTGMSGAIASLAAVSSSVYDVTVTGAGGDGTIRLDRKASASINDIAGNTVSSGTYTAGQVYTMRLLGSGSWITDESGGLWSDPANWNPAWGSVASGAGTTAEFNAIDATSDISLVLDSPRTIGRLVTGDVDYSTPMSWKITNGGNPANTLTLSTTGTPTIQVDAGIVGAAASDPTDVPAANAYPTILDASVVCTTGWTKLGIGTLKLTQPNPQLTGALTLTKGIVEVGEGGTFTPSSVTIATSQQLRVSGGSFSTPGNISWTSGTGTGVWVSGGTAEFKKILPSNARNSWFKVTGGVVTAEDISFPRSGDSETQTVGTGVLIGGGDTTVGTIGLGTNNSWAGMTISGGKLTVTGVVHNGYQVTAGRGGVIYVSGGEFNVLDSASGLIMSRNPGSQANNVSKLLITGGVTNLAKLTLGYDSTSSAGSATVAVTTGELNIGTGGIVKNGTTGMTTSITLNSGVLGAVADWSTTHPIVLAGSSADTQIRAGDVDGNAHSIVLAGPLTGAGGFNKTGLGTLTLAGANTFTGDVVVSAGALSVTGSLANGGALTVSGSGHLAVSGTINRGITLGDGGQIAPGVVNGGMFTGPSLVWNGGGAVAINIDTGSDALALSGALTKGTAGNYTFVCSPGAAFAAGNVYTVATFGSTDFDASDFSASGLPAGFAASFAIVGNSLQMTIVGTPFITSPASAEGTYGVPFSYTITAGNAPTSFGASGLPPGLTVDASTGVISGIPSAAGDYTAQISATNIAGTGTAPLPIHIAKAAATVTLSDLVRSYDGTPRNPTATTDPTGLNVIFTYDGSNPAPTYPGTYAVTATVDDNNYEGAATGTFKIVATVTVRHAPTLNGDVDGSVQMLNGEYVTMNGGAMISLDLLVPGMPTLRVNGRPAFGGTIDAAGQQAPAGYVVTLNGGAVLRNLVRRVDPVTLPTIAAIPQPTGTRYVNLNKATDPIGDFATVRNLTLNGNVGAVAIPAGTYGDFTANSNGSFVLGVPGASEPAVYNLQRLTLNGNATVQVVGPVVLRLANGTNFNGAGTSGAADNSFVIEIASGDLTLNGSVTLNASVVVPNGRVTVNGSAKLHGRVAADNLTLNGNAVVTDPELH